ncbi:hypothetical protein [Burkholderia ubonensis]|uniref:hypothetical protein n=1 Tax=Burkholderia ubonensis TaxID=101571 RepID=UPI000A9254AD|nr:hypothetical protein [Burkholderia ubonensis]
MHQHEAALLDFPALVEIFSSAAIRSGDFGIAKNPDHGDVNKLIMVLDRIADLPSADRAMYATVILSNAAKADEVIANVLEKCNAVRTIRSEIMRRRSNP